MNANSEFQTPGIRVPSRSFAVRKADVSALARHDEAIAKAEAELDELVDALYLPASRLPPSRSFGGTSRQAGALTPEEIKLVQSASVQTSARQGHAAK